MDRSDHVEAHERSEERRDSELDELHSHRDIDLAGRDMATIGKALAAAGDPSASLYLTAAAGSGDSAVAGEATADLGKSLFVRSLRRRFRPRLKP